MIISRRKLLKLSGGILAAAPFVRLPQVAYAESLAAKDPVITDIEYPFGRAMYGTQIREAPSLKSKVVKRVKQNELIDLLGQTTIEGGGYNPIWYKTSEGYVHSAFIFPSLDTLNKPVAVVDEKGFWAELTVPLSVVRSAPSAQAAKRYNAYTGMTFKIIGEEKDKAGKIWYKLEEDNWSYTKALTYLDATHVRPLTQDDFAPLSPDVPAQDKRIEISLKKQQAIAYEGDQAVRTMRIASGMAGYETPIGTHYIYVKTPGQRMFGGAAADTGNYDLPAIPWVSYFTSNGVSFHGTYWHNDYGRPRSHGCANVAVDDAHWIFRWANPVPVFEERWTRVSRKSKMKEEGTLVTVKY